MLPLNAEPLDMLTNLLYGRLAYWCCPRPISGMKCEPGPHACVGSCRHRTRSVCGCGWVFRLVLPSKSSTGSWVCRRICLENSFKQVAVFPSRTAEASDLFCTLSAAYELLLHHDQKSLIVCLVLTGREQERTTALVVLSCWVVVCCCLVLLVVRHVRNPPHYG
jgi:hypothetical protein